MWRKIRRGNAPAQIITSDLESTARLCTQGALNGFLLFCFFPSRVERRMLTVAHTDRGAPSLEVNTL